MRQKTLAIGLSLTCFLAGSAPGWQVAEDPLTRPIAPEFAARWTRSIDPRQIYGNSYLIGFTELNVGLIRSSEGLIIIDAGVPQGIPALEANIRRLGLRVADIKYILSTEPHFDHAGGLAALARDSGATVVAGASAVPTLRTGKVGSEDPQHGLVPAFPPVARVRAVRDGDIIRLGDVQVVARSTPGHTAGSMSWSWRSCEGKKCLGMVFASSLNPASADGYRFSATSNRRIVASYRSSFASVAALPCDILITAHPNQSGGDTKMAKLQAGTTPNPFIDPGACRRYANEFAATLDARLAREARGGEP